MPDPKSRRSAETALMALFRASGYIRRPAEDRNGDPATYKKGSEVRLVLETRTAARTAAQLARAVGLRPGKAYPKHARVVVPLYGADAVTWFLRRLRGRAGKSTDGFAADGTRTVRRPVNS